MANLFDALSATAFKATATTFGHDASWAPSSGGATLTARGHFAAPANPDRVGEVGPAPIEPVFEYRPADLPGLLESVRAGGTETLTIDGTSYAVAQVDPIHDGTTYLARLVAS